MRLKALVLTETLGTKIKTTYFKPKANQNGIKPMPPPNNALEYREQMARIAPFAKRVHIDFSDGQFAPVKLINSIQAYWPEGLTADFHFMFTDPKQHIETAISLRPDLVIIHAEAQGDLLGMIRELRAVNIKVGVAFLQQTDPVK